MSNANLSETLFKPVLNSPETSTLIHRNNSIKEKSVSGDWYRDIDKATWAWRGIDAIEFSDVQARIVMSTNPRTNNQLHDTVIGYRSGNWIYEWALEASIWQKKATAIAEENQTLAAQYWLKAAMLYSLASYPHLKNDNLANQIELLSYKAYSEATILLPGHCRTVEFVVDNNKVNGFLYLPDEEKGPYPTIILCSNLDSLQLDQHKLFYDFFAPAGLALLSIDAPGVGYSSRWKFSFDTSYLYQQILKQVAALPWVDQANLFIFGIKSAANAAIRLAYLEQKILRGAISFAGMVHDGLTSGVLVDNMSEMYKDVLASRLGLSSISDELLKAELSSYSLKNQGLLGRRCITPMFAIAVENDKTNSIEDAKLIASSSKQGKLLSIPSSPIKASLHKAATEITYWIKKQLV